MNKTSILITSALIAGIATQTLAFAGGRGGGSQFGQNPELYITIVERDQIKKRYRQYKEKPFVGSSNQRLGEESILYQIQYEDRRAKGKKPRKFGFRSKRK
ncbi:MAG: hypothetical protein ABJK39_02190 [Hyphomicrobiales bacterium]